jgi:hypothetical protein
MTDVDAAKLPVMLNTLRLPTRRARRLTPGRREAEAA